MQPRGQAGFPSSLPAAVEILVAASDLRDRPLLGTHGKRQTRRRGGGETMDRQLCRIERLSDADADACWLCLITVSCLCGHVFHDFVLVIRGKQGLPTSTILTAIAWKASSKSRRLYVLCSLLCLLPRHLRHHPWKMHFLTILDIQQVKTVN